MIIYDRFKREECKFLKLLEVLGQYMNTDSVIIFTDKQEHADSLRRGLVMHLSPWRHRPLRQVTVILKKN